MNLILLLQDGSPYEQFLNGIGNHPLWTVCLVALIAIPSVVILIQIVGYLRNRNR